MTIGGCCIERVDVWYFAFGFGFDMVHIKRSARIERDGWLCRYVALGILSASICDLACCFISKFYYGEVSLHADSAEMT